MEKEKDVINDLPEDFQIPTEEEIKENEEFEENLKVILGTEGDEE